MVAAMSERDWAAEFDEFYTTTESAVSQRIWRDVLGAEYPEGLDPNSLVTISELERYVEELRVDEGDLLVDAACGRGGPGLWVASRTGARLVGIDIAANAVEAARRRAAAAGLSDRAEYRLASFEDTGFDEGEADAVMSVDSLLFSEDKPAALAELHRILRPAGRLVFSSWDYSGQVPWRPLQLGDHRPLLDDTGFAVLAYDETEDWKSRQTELTTRMLQAVDELAAERNSDRSQVRTQLQQMRDAMQTMTRRVFVVAQRRN
jgi:ubiquinone/menaquinone biosynthesis C-methylase UbiE